MSLTPYYNEGGITIYHGDCREVLPHIPPVDLLLTDPPYGLGDKWQGGKAKWPLHHGRMAWDATTSDALEAAMNHAEHAIVWGGHLYPLPPSRGWLVWDKLVREFTSGHCEFAWTTLDQPIRAFNYAHGQLETEGKFHPCQKPVPLMSWCLRFAPTARTVLDTFMGSGSTLVAAKLAGLQAIGIEQEESDCETAVKRLAQGVLFGGAA